MSQHAAVTIVSKNYFAFARTLAESYRKHHPDHDFLIVLVDRADGMVPPRLECGAQVVEIAAFEIPDLSRMIYRYSIMELNTAVKPFVLAHLFRHHAFETLLYIDPDIWLFGPLQAVYDGLERASIVLTPHMRRPYYDDAMPSDTAILQSGTYNLGFIGLRRGGTSERLLQWWMTKLYRDCIVDIPNGLFVDQKWIDLVPGFFPDHEILYHPGYNAAYWNLHERAISQVGEQWRADDEPLVFFHFSGYVPYAPETLSKHQNRHKLPELPDLKRLTDLYAQALVANGYEESHRWPYAFARLPNQVTVPLDLVARVMQWASRAGVATPCPVTEPERFCRFLMGRGTLPDRPDAVLLLDFLLRNRPDVAAAFPGAVKDSNDPGFRAWIASSGVQEHRLADLLPFEATESPVDLVEDAFTRLRLRPADDGPDIADALASGSEGLQALVRWIRDGHAESIGLGPRHAAALESAAAGVQRILHLYFLRGDLQNQFPDLSVPEQLQAFGRWLREQRYVIDLNVEQVSLFHELALANADLLARAAFLYLHRGRTGRSDPTIYGLDARRNEVGSRLDPEAIAQWLAAEPAIEPADHYRMRFGADTAPLEEFGRVSVPELDTKSNFEFVKKVRAGMADAAPGKRPLRINLAGFMSAATGMGESGRSMRATLAAAGLTARESILPHASSESADLPASAALFGWPQSDADLSIVVANADSHGDIQRCLPRSFHGRRRVGFWVWETERLPSHLRASQSLFDEIWAPSRYSADAIARTVNRPVHVLPHTLDFVAIDAARADRARFGLPEGAAVFGFAFDPLSVLERKNVRGLVRAFQAAMRADDNAYLVLKINTRRPAGYEFDSVLAEITSDRVLVQDGVLDREGTFSWLKSLDAYVSLHRAEGFGLTCAEAMACGLPVVASRYSGNLDFMTEDNGVLVPTEVVETERPYGPYPAGTRWGQPDHQAAVGALRSVLSSDTRRRVGEAARTSIRRQLDPKAVGVRLAALVGTTAGVAPAAQ